MSALLARKFPLQKRGNGPWPQATRGKTTRLEAYVRELRTAWRDADKAQRQLFDRTLFEQIGVVGDQPFSRIYRFRPKHRTHLVPASAGTGSPEPQGAGQSHPLH